MVWRVHSFLRQVRYIAHIMRAEGYGLSAALRARLRGWFESRAAIALITSLILLNALVLGLETYPGIVAEAGAQLRIVDQTLLWIFVGELSLRLFAYGPAFFRDRWNLFDAAVICIAFLPANQAFAVLRAARVLRVLRLISIMPRLRRVIEGFLQALPGIGAIGAILTIVFYVFAVMAAKLFGAAYPEWFGNLHVAMFSLFQIMTLEGWADMVREIGQTHVFAPAFFILYILIATFTILNLFIAVIVDAMHRLHQKDVSPEQEALGRIEQELSALRSALKSQRVETFNQTPS